MDRRQKAEWFFVGLAAGWALLIIVGVAVLVLVNRADENDPFGGVKPDMGESLHQIGRPAQWEASHMRLGNSGFTAAVGPNRYEDKDDRDWDHYSIDVEKSVGQHSYVFFQRDYRIDQIPKTLVTMKVHDIVKFDEEAGVVVFNLGSRTETYTLPKR